jgi:transcription-repair coupling factor (superfamily II helicase)
MQIEDLVEGQYYINISFGVCIYRRTEEFNNITYAIFQFAKYQELNVRKEDINKAIRNYDISSKDSNKEIKLDVLKENNSWQKKKAKALEQIRMEAKELSKLYAKRVAQKGFQYTVKDEYIEEFKGLLDFELTSGQEKVINEINSNMISDKVIKQLVNADCGFGKSVIMQYVSFIALKNHKQCVILASSTILAKQHYDDYVKLFGRFNARIELLNGDITAKNKQEILNEVETGEVDILIGTSALVQKEIAFSNLQMLLIDEPQVQGVKAKEYISQYQDKNIDILQFSATFQPRDLCMVQNGILDMSIISTPPKSKRPIITEQIGWDDNKIKNIISYELNREGKLYFVYNNIEALEKIKEQLLNLIPDLKIAVMNGKMNKKTIAEILKAFKLNQYNVLLCTSLIETGINIDANTIIIYGCERLGLSSLHQMRNRVARFGKQGYCYLIPSKEEEMKEIASKRLNVLCKNNQLGAGMNISNEDMKLRGQGEIFGTKQHGFIMSIGMELYKEILNKYVEEEKLKLG